MVWVLTLALPRCGGDSGQSNGNGNDAGTIAGDPCLALEIVFATADCSDPAACPPVQCDCGGSPRSFGACSDDRCASAVNCEVLCALSPGDIHNCVVRIYGPTVECSSSATCAHGPCVDYLGVQQCRDLLWCRVDAQCTHHCADRRCAEEPLQSCSSPSECTWACINDQCTSGFAGSPCTESSECEANFCVAQKCSTGDIGEGCFAGSNCRTGHCDDNVCVGIPVGGQCVREEDCVVEYCVDGVCTDGQRGSPCNGGIDCVGDCDNTSSRCL